ncbi:efflux RND transporter permease subunit [Cupriavidus basilensis]
MILSVTFVPAAVALFIGDKVAEKENRLMLWAKRAYAPMLGKTIADTPVVLTLAAVAVLLSGLVATRLGSEFIPNLNEGDIAVQALRIPGTSLTQSLAMQQQIETRLKEKFPEIERVFARTGTAEIASDPMPPNSVRRLHHAQAAGKVARSVQDARATAGGRWRPNWRPSPATSTNSRSRSSCGSTN